MQGKLDRNEQIQIRKEAAMKLKSTPPRSSIPPLKLLTSAHRLRCDLPDFRRAAGRPCRFMPFGAGRAGMPFESRHCSRRELRGPCVDIRFVSLVEGPAPESRSIASAVREFGRTKRKSCVDGIMQARSKEEEVAKEEETMKTRSPKTLQMKMPTRESQGS